MTAVGFSNAPVSKGVVIFTTLASLAGAYACHRPERACRGLLRALSSLDPMVPRSSPRPRPCAASATRAGGLGGAMGPLSLSALLSKRELWRVATYQLAFSSAGELVVGILLLYTLRQFERHWGSRKFGAFIVISKLVSFVTSSSALLCWRGGSAAPPLAAGPYGKPNVRVESASSTWVVNVHACIHAQTPDTHIHPPTQGSYSRAWFSSTSIFQSLCPCPSLASALATRR